MKNVNVSFNDYMNKSLIFKTHIEKYCEPRNYNLERIFDINNLLDSIDNKSQKDEIFRNEFFKWFSNKKGYSTIKLRELCKIIGFNYWENLKIANVIDVLDSCKCMYKSKN